MIHTLFLSQPKCNVQLKTHCVNRHGDEYKLGEHERGQVLI